MKRKTFRFMVLLVIAACMVMVCGNAMAGGTVTNMRYFIAPDHTRIVFDLTEPPVYTTSHQDGNLIITFPETTCAETVSPETGINKAGIGKLSIIAMKEGDVLVRLGLGSDTEVNVFSLKKFQDKPDRLVIDVELPEVSRQESRMREQIKVSKKKKIIIIDPGHGGDDPGAVGKKGTYEKDVVLAISRRLKKTLDRHGFYQAYLTRDGDYYVPFNKRLQIAREYGADLFISVHADAAKNREARGSSVYCLSTGEASSVAAKILAQDENLADIVGGVQASEMVEETNPILINMCQTNTINVSKAFGMSVLWELSNVGELKFEKVQEAPFRVLKMPEIPAVLIETAYISNSEEEKLLRSTAFQKKISDSISRTVVQFFDKASPATGQGALATGEETKEGGDTGSSAVKNPLPRPFSLYTVAKGDTLTNIAGRFGVTVQEIVVMNGLQVEAPLHVGKRLKIQGEDKAGEMALRRDGAESRTAGRKDLTQSPPPRTENPEKKRVFSYTVARGDNLSRIADRFGMPLADLLEINGLKANAPLYVGKRLKIMGERKEKDGTVSTGVAEDTVAERKEAKETESPDFFIYTVAKGDNLSRIADRFNVSLSSLLEMNELKMDAPLYVGRRLKIAGDSREMNIAVKQGKDIFKQAGSGKRAYRTYKVKKGDTLLAIAQEQGVSVTTLLELNRMKLHDPLYQDRVLIVGLRNNP